MSRRQKIPGFAALNAADATVNQTSAISVVESCDKASYHIKFSANNTGAFTIEARNSEADSWYVLDFGVSLAITSQSDVILNINQINFHSMRLNWLPSAGSGTVTAYLFGASEGA